MAEVMTSEAIIEAYWLLQDGFWTKPRFTFQTKKGAWSDVDVLAYNPESKHLVIAESKVRGDKWDIFSFTQASEELYGNILEYDDGQYFTFLKHLPRICTDKTIFTNFRETVEKLTIQLVSNYFITKDLKAAQEKVVCDKIRSKIPKAITLDVRLDSTLEIICDIVARESESSQGRRYGHPVLDIARELNRYLYQYIRYAGNKESKQAVQQEIDELFETAFCSEIEKDA